MFDDPIFPENEVIHDEAATEAVLEVVPETVPEVVVEAIPEVVAPESEQAPVAVKATDAILEAWFEQHFHNIAELHLYNRFRAALEDLKGRL